MRKMRKFASDGFVDEMEAANQGEDLAAEQRGENILKAMRDAETKPKVVTPKAQRAKLDVPNVSSPRPAASPMSTDPSQQLKPKYQSLQDRGKENAAKRKESGVGMYGTRNSAKDTRTPKRARNLTDMLGLSSQYAKGGSIDGIAQRGKTRGKVC